MLQKDKEYTLKVLGIERGNAKPRKDIAKWSDLKENIDYMYEDEFEKIKDNYELQTIQDKEKIKQILNTYVEKYFDINEANPGKYEAHVGDVSTVIRIALTGRTNTPDMYEIMQVLGADNVVKRLKKFE